MFNKIYTVYEKLMDQRSKEIFINRMNYSFSKDKSYLDKIVLSEMKAYGEKDILKRCEAWIKNKKISKVSLFGAGFAGQQIVNAMSLLGIKVDKVYDNNEAKWGKTCKSVKIYSPQDLSDKEYIIIGVNFQREHILQQLLGCGIDESHIYVPDALWWLGEYSQYFDKEIMKPEIGEVFVDGGSLDGGDSKNFIEWCGGKYDKIYAFEPDSSSVRKVQAVSEQWDNFEVLQVGLWSDKNTLRFSSGNEEGSSISENGDISVEVDSIDNVLEGQKATFIKMDIEGSELQALEGAVNTIKQYKPKLAICVYHKPEDIIDIPLKILEINPNYRFYLRHYSYVNTETVLYAVDDGN